MERCYFRYHVEEKCFDSGEAESGHLCLISDWEGLPDVIDAVMVIRYANISQMNKKRDLNGTT